MYKKITNKKKFVLTILIITFFITSNYFRKSIKKPPLTINMQDSSININKYLLDLFSFGQKRLITSILWVHTLMESDNSIYKKKDNNSWMFLRFDTITHLDPNFYEAYYYGGQYLSIIKDDDIGAKIIYEKGLEHYPDKFWLQFHAAFHYLTEIKDIKKAYKISAFTDRQIKSNEWRS